MSYEKQTWANGNVITAEKLNHMEDGIYNANELIAVNAFYLENDGQRHIDGIDVSYNDLVGILREKKFPVVIASELVDADGNTTPVEVQFFKNIKFMPNEEWKYRAEFVGYSYWASSPDVEMIRHSTEE